MAKKFERPQLKRPGSLDSLFGIEGSKTAIDIEISSLISFKDHPFKVNEDESMADLVESIKAHGVLLPILVRPVAVPSKARYEILAGHRRTRGSELAGLDTVPALVLNDLSDEEALAYVIESNLMQRSFSDMAHSEKAAVIALHHSKMFSQGKRNDILKQLKMLEEPHQSGSTATFRQDGEESNSDRRVADMYSLSPRVVSRYLRINQLCQILKDMLDTGGIAFMPAVALSFLTEDQQQMLASFLKTKHYHIDTKKAELLREYSSKGNLNSQTAFHILTGQTVSKYQKARAIKFSKGTYEKYFTSEQSAKEVASIVEEALEFYFNLQNVQGDT